LLGLGFQPSQVLLRQVTTAPSLNEDPIFDNGHHGRPIDETTPKVDNVAIEDKRVPDYGSKISETLDGITEEDQSESTASLLEQVENCSLAIMSSVKAAPLTKPVYLTLSRLLYPEPGEPAANNHVIQLDPTVFNHSIRRDIIHLCVVHYRDSLRQGSANTKTRSEVRGSGRKIRPQKGTGKARLGDAQSPMLRGGGIAFGPKPRDFSTKLPKKVIEMGMRVALSAKLKEQRLGVVESIDWPGIKTRHLARRIASLGWHKTLFVTGQSQVPMGLLRSGNNIPNIDFTTVDQLKVYDIVYWPRIVLDAAAVDLLEARLSKMSPDLSQLE